ncbi:retrovirus-related pol polyprotein from transposon TNT 1-94 [Tanacetum coccineum]
MTVTKSSSHDTRVIVQNVQEGPFPTGVILDDSNYPLWSQLMEMRIGARNKMGFITGDTPKPTADEKQTETWPLDNNLLFELNRRSFTTRQNGRSLPTYYNELVSIFQEIDTRLTTQEETVAETDTPLDLDSCYAYIRKDQNQRQTMEETKTDSDSIVHLATRNHTTKGKSSNNKGNTYTCTHCGEEGHSKQRCYKIIGYPDLRDFTKKPRKKISQASVATSSKEEPPVSVAAHTKTVNNSAVGALDEPAPKVVEAD